MKPVAALFSILAFGWALVTAADARHEAKPTEVSYQVLTVESEREQMPTPIADALVDWDEVDRQTDCLWVFLTEHFGHDITLDRVLAAGYWTDVHGGACLVIGEDDE